MLSFGHDDAPARNGRHMIGSDEIHAELNAMRSTLRSLSQALAQASRRRAGTMRSYASETVDEAEEVMKEHLAASVLLAAGLGVLVGYFLRGNTR